jgi:hypothetical protein
LFEWHVKFEFSEFRVPSFLGSLIFPNILLCHRLTWLNEHIF